MRQSGGGVQELHCTHRFHKEVRHILHVRCVCMSPLCLHVPDLPLAKEFPLVYSNPSIPDIITLCMKAAHSLVCMMCTGIKNNLPTPETNLCGSMEPSESFPAWSEALTLTDHDVSRLVGAEGGQEVRAVSAPQRQWSVGLSGEEALGWEEEVCRRAHLHGEERGAVHTPP